MSSHVTRVLLVDGQRAFAELFAEKLNTQLDFEVVGIVNHGDDAMPRIMHVYPSIVVLDIDVLGRSAFDIAREAASKSWRSKFIFVSNHYTDIALEQITRVRTSGCMTKQESVEFLIAGLRRVVNNGTSYSVEIAERIEAIAKEGHSSGCSLSALTLRQIEVLRNLAKGESVKEVAAVMNLSEKSIDSHKYRIMRRLGIHDRVKLALFAVREGLVLP